MAQAALFHDIAKDLPSQDLMALIREHGIAIDDLDLGYPAILHGPVGAWMAQTRHGVSDSGVLHAIANHTVGVPQPDAMLRVLMLADSIEPGRNYAGVEEARQLAASDPDAALRLVLQMKLDHVMGKGRTPHPRATAMLDSLRCAAMEVA
jgi:predicted HD superfamily hydrolase involved in NAD metabolism